MNGMSDPAEDDLVRGEGLIGEALAASPRYASAHFVKGEVLRAQGRFEEALPEYETALALNRNLMFALAGLAWCKLYAGLIEEVIPLLEQAIRLSPREPRIGHCYYLIGTVHLLQSRTDEAIICFEKGRTAVPGIPFHHAVRIPYSTVKKHARALGYKPRQRIATPEAAASDLQGWGYPLRLNSRGPGF
jgi:tetratricopeptide (TPR) repeat protein